MNLTQRVGMLLTGSVALSSWSPAWAQSNEATKPKAGTANAASPNGEAPQPFWPQPPKAPSGTPNVVLILVDDVGFGATGTFGGPIPTPVLDKLAGDGLKYNSFHMNSLCSPTRSALLTGRNNHQVGFGSISEWSAPYPGYNTLLPKSSAMIAEVLKENGYSTAAFGKWHNTPTWQVSPAGPFDRWPTSLGFEHFYGFLQAADNQYFTRIYRDQTPVEPGTTPEQGYHFTTDITNDAIKWLHQHDAVAGEKPFFIYYATGATHTPHQVPKKYVEAFKGKFDEGWDVLRQKAFDKQKALGVIPANAELTPRPDGMPAWDSLTPDQKKLLAHQMEVYAGFLAQTDYEIGRLLDAIRDEGQADNTVVMEIVGDNGASAEGGMEGTDAHDVNGKAPSIEARLDTADLLGSEIYMNHFAAAWAWGLSSPFQGTKQDASHLGGTTDPLVIVWPGHIKDAGGLRSQFSHVNDIAPTIYDIVGIKPPEEINGVKQTPLEGTSLTYTFDNPNAPTRHRIQYFSTSGNRAIYKDGWWAGDLFHTTWETGGIPHGVPDEAINTHPWELYNLNDDYSQAHNLADKNPEKLKELQALFASEATRNQAYPLLPAREAFPVGQAAGQKVFTYRSGVDRLQPAVGPQLGGRAYSITADIDVPIDGADGVIVAQGGRYGGLSLFVKDRRVVYEINAFGNRSGQLVATDSLQPGKAHIVLNLVPNGDTTQSDVPFQARKPLSAVGQLSINGHEEGQAQFTNVNTSSGETLDIGSDLGSPVSSDYRTPNRFTGKIEKVTIDLK
jgi:arylsulfatase A-like enzyme